MMTLSHKTSPSTHLMSINHDTRILSLLVLVLLPYFPVTIARNCFSEHHQSLLRLKQGFRASADTNPLLSSWTWDTDCCQWQGVTCNATTGEVVALHLGSLSISGIVEPTALLNVTSLTYLDLSSNFLDFSRISSSQGFDLLGELEYLNLSASGIQGRIPCGIGKLRKLIQLDLSTINVYSPVYLKNPSLGSLLQNLTNLELLYLDGISIPVDAAWSRVVAKSVPKLRALSMSGCSLSGPIDESLSNLRFLTELRLDRNNLGLYVPALLWNFSSLKILSLASCGLHGQIPETIFHLRNLMSIDMSDNPALSGILPESLGNLASLQTLRLSGCNFSGVLPASIDKLTNLTVVDLSSNNFIGSIMKFTKFKNLCWLDLHDNSFSGPVPVSFFSLPKLQTLLLSQNRLSGNLAPTPNYSYSLQNLDLSTNMLQGLFPLSIFRSSNLRILICSDNTFYGTVDLTILNNLPNLINLDLSNNLLTVASPNNLSTFPVLQTLKLAYCNLTVIPGFLRYQTYLSDLDLSRNRIVGDIPSWIWNVASHLNLSNNLFTGFEGPAPDLINSTLTVIDLHENMSTGPLSLLPRLNIIVDLSNNSLCSSFPPDMAERLKYSVFLSVSNNNLIGSIPSSICSCSNLLVLDLSYNQLSGILPPCVAELDSLVVLNLQDNYISGPLPSNFTNNCQLKALNVNGNRLDGIIPESVQNCSDLEVIDVGNNQLSGYFPLSLGYLPKLRVLVLRSNRFNGTLECFSCFGYALKTLQVLDLSSNEFDGKLSSRTFENLESMMLSDEKTTRAVQFKFLDFTKLYYQDIFLVTSKGQNVTLAKQMTIKSLLDVSNNKFDGSILEIIGNLGSLFFLNMSHNMLTGRIPSSLGNLSQLQSLDLSWNMLSGDIPKQLNSLGALSYLNISYNALSGEIPSAGHLATFPNESYLGGQNCFRGSCLVQRRTGSNSFSVGENSFGASYKFDMTLCICILFGFCGGFAFSISLLLIWNEGRR